ncbi:DUF3237 domain-containing protein [Tepidicaulis sp. LMO-SS28]|uniref:DUF3237 domain-containing protein n=1 Tax=Tepidicaulis sp. LMO-SS28 TaxID=3447455 RepID=UPI003EDF1B60
MSDVKTEFLFEINVELIEPSIMVGAMPEGARMIANLKGGTFKGPKLSGTVHQSGADWAIVRADGSIKLDVRAALNADDGTQIYVAYGGRIVVPQEHMAVLGDKKAAAELDPSKYYFRSNPLFEVAMDSPHAWLNGIVAVGVGRFTETGVAYKVYQVL